MTQIAPPSPRSRRRASDHHATGRGARRAVLLVPDYLPHLGGTTTQGRSHALELARRGWDVTILTRRVGPGGSSEQIDGIPVRRVGPRWRGPVTKALGLLSTWWWLLRRRRSISALSVLMVADLAMCAWAAGLGRSTVLTWVTAGDPTRQLGGRRGRIRRFLLRNCKHVVLTQPMEAELADLSVTVADVVAVPVDVAWFRPPTTAEREAARAGLEVPGHLVVFIGHLQARKAVDRLLGAVKLLRDDGREVSLVLVGGPVEPEDADYVAHLERYVEASSLSAVVRFAGAHRDVRPFLFAADLLCLPSEREGMPNVLLEAMACGVPCVAPASAGGDILLGEGGGAVPSSNHSSDLARAIASLLDDPGARDRIRQRGLCRVRRSHRIESIVDRYETLIGGPAT